MDCVLPARACEIPLFEQKFRVPVQKKHLRVSKNVEPNRECVFFRPALTASRAAAGLSWAIRPSLNGLYPAMEGRSRPADEGIRRL